MGDVRLPLSGNVWQDFNPFRWFFDSVGQMSFFTVNVGRSSDPQVEQAILEVASYGRQLGRIGEALLAITEHTDVSDYTGDQKSAVEDFKALMREIAAAKRRATQERATTALVVPLRA
jgi:hypothetical protein